mmetsp:Transcript_42573/g.92552  ORF Transcript_42573/g.92552 Transcript_42573/m.92552 type:complete len:202 (+) Transcript_42573:89-694(+)
MSSPSDARHYNENESLDWISYRGSVVLTPRLFGARCTASCCSTAHFWSRDSSTLRFCACSSSYLRLTSSYSTSSRSWNIFRTFIVSPCTAGFQWLALFSSSAGSTIGSRTCRCCATRLTTYSLFHRNSARSATWKCWLLRLIASCLNSGCMTAWNSGICVSSRISSSSPKNSTSFALLVSGQNLSSCRSTGSASLRSFSTN